jgi:DNA-binding response OmpR family regulator
MAEPGPKVLLVDDEPMVRETGRRYLTRAGYTCIEAESIHRAVALISHTTVQAAILDVRLPGHVSGLDLLEAFREQSGLAEIPVLIMTGGVLTPEEETSIARQRAFLFYKPEGFGAIVKFLDQLTGRHHDH